MQCWRASAGAGHYRDGLASAQAAALRQACTPELRQSVLAQARVRSSGSSKYSSSECSSPDSSSSSASRLPSKLESAGLLLRVQRDTRNIDSADTQWLLVSKNVQLLEESPLLAPDSLHLLLCALCDSPQLPKALHHNTLMTLAASMCRMCCEKASSMGPEQLQPLLLGAVKLVGPKGLHDRLDKLSKEYTRAWYTREVKKVLAACLPSAMRGATCSQVLACLNALEELRVKQDPAFMTKLMAALQLPQDRYLETCDAAEFMQLVKVLRQHASNSTALARAPVPDAVKDQLSAAAARLAGPPLKLAARSSKRSKAGSSSDEGEASDDEGEQEERRSPSPAMREPAGLLSPTDRAAVASLLFSLPQTSSSRQMAWRLLNDTLQGDVSRAADELAPLFALALRAWQSERDAAATEGTSSSALRQRKLGLMCSKIISCPRNDGFASSSMPALLRSMLAVWHADKLAATPYFLSRLVSFVVSVQLSRGNLNHRVTATELEDLTVATIDLLQAYCDGSPAHKGQDGARRPGARRAALAQAAAHDASQQLLSRLTSANTLTRLPLSQQELMGLMKLSLAAQASDASAQSAMESALIKTSPDPAVLLHKLLLPMVRSGIPPSDPHTLDACLLPVGGLVAQLSPADMTALLNTLSQASWIGRSLMRDRLLVAAHQLLNKCTTAAEGQALVQAAARFAATPVSERKSTRLTHVYYDVAGQVVAPSAQEWVVAVEQLFSGSAALSGPAPTASQRVWLLYSLCVQLGAHPSQHHFLHAALINLATDETEGFKACSAQDVVRVLELVKHLGAAPAEHGWTQQLLQTASQQLVRKGVQGEVLGSALDCLATLADPSLQVLRPPEYERTSSGTEHMQHAQQQQQQQQQQAEELQQDEKERHASSTAHKRTAANDSATGSASSTGSAIRTVEQVAQHQWESAAEQTSAEASAYDAVDSTTTGVAPTTAAAAAAGLPSVASSAMSEPAAASNPTTQPTPPAGAPASTSAAAFAAAMAAQAGGIVGQLVRGRVLLVNSERAIVEVEGHDDLEGHLMPANVSAAPVAQLSSVVKKQDEVCAVVLSQDGVVLNLSTRELEPWPGAMLTHAPSVYAAAEAMWAAKQAALQAVMQQYQPSACQQQQQKQQVMMTQERTHKGQWTTLTSKQPQLMITVQMACSSTRMTQRTGGCSRTTSVGLAALPLP